MTTSEYPTRKELKTIRKWPITTRKDTVDLLAYIKDIWERWGFFTKRGSTYWLSTGGWSGNEEIIEAMKENAMFWMLCWYSSKRGGHYVFKIPRIAAKGPTVDLTKERKP